MASKHQLLAFLSTATVKLAATYLAIIMLMSISYSVIFFNTSTRQFNRPTPMSGQIDTPFGDRVVINFEIQRVLQERLDAAREELLVRLIWINIGTLIAGSVISYMLARMSLRPIEQSMEAQSQFISDASHELRTPLTVLQTTNEVALRKKKLPENEAREILDHNVVEVKKLRDLSNTLLELLKDNPKKVTLASVNVQNAISDSLPNIVTLAQSKNITVEDKVQPLKVYSNQAILSQVLSVLLDNAVKYSKPDGSITLSSEVVGKKVYLNITDTGVGISASDLPHIFRRFYRADKSRTSNITAGHGLGLAIADKLSKQINVKIEVTSSLGEGSTFTLVIPASQADLV